MLFILLKVKRSANYNLTKIDDILNKVIPHFSKYKLLSQKNGDFFFMAAELIKSKAHNNLDGFKN